MERNLIILWNNLYGALLKTWKRNRQASKEGKMTLKNVLVILLTKIYKKISWQLSVFLVHLYIDSELLQIVIG